MKSAHAKTNGYGQKLARQAGLRYVLDDDKGYSRELNGSGYKYLNCQGRVLRGKKVRERIEGLVIPPAWKDVWICRFDNGHLQVTGYDSRKRKQYLYHPRWQEVANLEKFARLGEFGNELPSIRRKIQSRLRGRKVTRDRVLAGMVAILDATSIRVGNEEYVKANNSYGLTTLRNRHLAFEKDAAILRFAGKSGVRQELLVKAKQCVRLLRHCHQLPGSHVFQYLDEEGLKHTATAAEVNEFLQELTDKPFTAKDFRNWAASALVIGLLIAQKDAEPIARRKRIVRDAIKQAAQLLGNTQATSRKYYVHPRIIESYENGEFSQLVMRFKPSCKNCFSQDEQLLAYFLKRAAADVN
jgi:DNA topoisomerase I